MFHWPIISVQILSPSNGIIHVGYSFLTAIMLANLLGFWLPFVKQ
jgi:hypothetical protein